jgi:pimeloyl-ACP methyl ester carboxylesterase
VDIDRPIDVKVMAGDIVALIEQLGLDRPDLVGYSMGGGVAFFTALQRPDLVRRLVIISTAMRDSAYYPELRAQQGQVTAEAAEFMKETPMYQLYASLAPRVEDWPRLVGKVGESMAAGFDHSAEVAKLQPPTLIMFADGDMSPPSHAVEVYEALGGGQQDGGWDKSGLPKHQLAIVPGETHYSMGATPKIVPVITAFLAEGEKGEEE